MGRHEFHNFKRPPCSACSTEHNLGVARMSAADKAISIRGLFSEQFGWEDLAMLVVVENRSGLSPVLAPFFSFAAPESPMNTSLRTVYGDATEDDVMIAIVITTV